MKRALISVSDKSGVVDFAKELSALGYEILSTGGTSKTLRDAGIEVIYTIFHRVIDQFFCGIVIYCAVFARQPHRTVAEQGKCVIPAVWFADKCRCRSICGEEIDSPDEWKVRGCQESIF